jgi:DNA-binding NarL/FixJ family response regulator
VIRVLLADDHLMFRHAVHKMLGDDPEIEIVGHAGDGNELLEQAAAVKADVVCTDINMPKLDGVEATRRLREQFPDIRVIGVSAHIDKSHILAMLNAGAVGFVHKASAGDELLAAIRTARHGRTYLCPNAMNVVTESIASGSESGPASALARLGARERQVLLLFADGLKAGQIASRLEITPATVDVHRRNILHKLELNSLADMVKFAIRHGLTSVDK